MATLRLVPASGNAVDVAQDVALVGRDPGCDIVLTDGSVSRRHARVERRGPAWYVVDLGSANGTFVNGARATEAALSGGAELRFGAVAFRVDLGDNEANATVRTPVPSATILHAGATPPPAAVPPAPPARVAPPFAAGRSAGMPVDEPELVAPPRARGRGPWFWVGGGCCGCLLMAVLAVSAFLFYSYKKTTASVDVVRQLIADVQRADYQSAHDRLSRELKAEFSLEQFVDLVNQHPGLSRNASVQGIGIQSSTTSGTQVTVLLVSTAGEQERAAFGLVSEDGQVRISSIRFEDSAPSP